jgi:hypothetical protein
MMMLICTCSSNKSGVEIGLNQNIHHDDFEYSVTGITKTKQFVSASDTFTANGIFYLVHFKVINNALRVGHRWDNSIGYLVDENDNRFENINEKQVALNKSLVFGWKELYDTHHGQTDSTILVFDIPVNVTRPYLKIRGGILMGDVFDAGRFRKIKVRLY